MNRRTAVTALAFVLAILSSCTRTRVVQSRYVVSSEISQGTCPYTWHHGDYWEFLAWALLDDPGAASALAVTAGYTPETYPSPGTEISLPLHPEYTQAAELRLQAARLVREATHSRDTDRSRCYELLQEAVELDDVWSVPVTNLTVLMLEDGRTDEALALLAPLSHKSAPAMIMAGIEWQKGNTAAALMHLSEALATDRPSPEALAAAGIAWSVTGDRLSAATAFRRLLENPDAPSELRVMALQYALRLGD